MLEESIFVVIVLYNKYCADSSTCMSLRATGAAAQRVVVFDNSTRDYGNAQYCLENGWSYLTEGANVGLSRAYNKCIDHIRRTTHEGYVCLFDDDTTVDAGYFLALRKAIIEKKRTIIAPTVYSGGRLLSPCFINKHFITRRLQSAEELGAIPEDRLSAINSGMAVHLSLFDNYQYDENIFLDGIDHKFLYDMKCRGEVPYIMPYACFHDFSGDMMPGEETAGIRFRIFLKDYAYILRDMRMAYLFLAIRRTIRLTLQYKTGRFVRMLAAYLLHGP